MENSEINEVHTSCKDCVFADYSDPRTNGCAAKQISKFKKHGIEVLECYDEENNEFFVINGRRCRLARSYKWAAKQGKSHNRNELVKIAQDEATIRPHGIVIMNDSITDLKKTLKSLENQSLKPSIVSIIRPFTCKLKPSEIVPVLRELSLSWKLENLLDDITLEHGVDIAVNRYDQYVFYSVFKAGYTVPRSFFKKLNTRINEEFLQFAALLPHKDNGLTVLRDAHKFFGGNRPITLVEKLKEENIKCQKISEVVKMA